MTKKVKLLFDECVGKPAMEALPALLRFSKHEFEFVHVLDHQKQGERDEVWIPKLATQGWMVITGDRGKGGRTKGEKLPIVCQRLGITHIMFGPSLHQATTFDKVQAIVHVWDAIASLLDEPPGSGWLLARTQFGSIRLTQKLPQKPGGGKKSRAKP